MACLQMLGRYSMASTSACLRGADLIPRVPKTMLDRAYTSRVEAIHRALCIPADYAALFRLALYEEPAELADAGVDFLGRKQRLTPMTLAAWSEMQAAAVRDGIKLLMVSAYRSVDYQVQIFQRKLEAGQTIEQILRVNAAPGYSEHHTGRAIDIGTPDSPVLEECFEDTQAYRWLCSHGGEFGFTLSFPRNKSSGIGYEPWHWCHHASLGSP